MNYLERIRQAADLLPDGSSVVLGVEHLRQQPDEVERPGARGGVRPEPPGADATGPDWTWREKLWVVPAETRLGVEEACEALRRSSSWLYKRTGDTANPAERLPVRRAHGQLTFTAGELRTWIREHEEVICGLPMTTTESEREAALRVVGGGGS